MAEAWGKYKNGEIPLKAMIKVQGWYFEPHTAARMVEAIAECRRHKIKLIINEGYRPLGKPSDQYVTNIKRTSTSGPNQWYYWGVHKRGGPLAAVPGTSSHGWGKAADVQPTKDSKNGGLLVAIMKHNGFTFNVPSEPWHVVG